MSSFQFYTSNSCTLMFGSALAYGACGHYKTAVAFTVLGLVILIATGFAAAAGDK